MVQPDPLCGDYDQSANSSVSAPRVAPGDYCKALFHEGRDAEGDEWPTDWYPGTVSEVRGAEVLIAWEGQWSGKVDPVAISDVYRDWYLSTDLKNSFGYVMSVPAKWDGPITALGSPATPYIEIVPARRIDLEESQYASTLGQKKSSENGKTYLIRLLWKGLVFDFALDKRRCNHPSRSVRTPRDVVHSVLPTEDRFFCGRGPPGGNSAEYDGDKWTPRIHGRALEQSHR
jgi:hypothetical protein